MARESFLVYGSWQEPIARLSNESKGLLFYALLEYHNSGQEIDLPIDAQMAFLFMKKQMDLDADKYLATCEKRAAAGRKGGQKSKSKQNKQMLETISKKSKSKQSQANQADKEKEYEKEKDNDVVVQQHAHTTATTSKITKELIDRYRAELSNKFYVPGRTDAICRAAMIHYKGVPFVDIVRIANGEPPETDYQTGKPKWAFDRELDVAAALRTWKRRIVEQWEAGNGA